MIEAREESTENLVRHVGFEGQTHALILRLCFSHTEKSAIELTILEAAGQYVGQMRFQTALTWVGRIYDRGSEVDIGLLSQPGSSRERE
ncbi:hypothetical protein SAZ_14735 [Streptomyces noursei ZPM]|nr:hypothetical protein SAZ_14735 [Streptomyces noursei ZPM]EPY93198.1 hypothetical protein K530_49210 [Streptomyces noursei CCRC 11814]